MNEELKSRLLEAGLTEEQITALAAEGVTSEDDLALLDASQIKAATNCGIVTAKKIAAATADAVAPKANAAAPAQAFTLLPALPDDASFLDSLKVGGVLKVDKTAVLAATRAGIANRTGLYEAPDRILAKMETHSLSQDEPFGEGFFKIQKVLTERRYGDVLSALGVPGNFMSDRRKKAFLDRVDAVLWDALASFHATLAAWQDSWLKSTMHPGVYMFAMARPGAQLPPGVMAPPDTLPIRAASETVIDQINHIFAGPGIPVARALAYDAVRIKGILDDPSLLVQVGATTREQMLKDLGLGVSTEVLNTEQTAPRYALAVMELSKVPQGDTELAYLGALYQLGQTIPWDKLGAGAGIGKRL